MNNRRAKPLQPDIISLSPASGSVCVATTISAQHGPIIPAAFLSPGPSVGKLPVKANSRKNHTLQKDTLHILKRGEISHIISENYSYKTHSYYTILSMEIEGREVQPSTAAIIDAFVVPICLERAKLAGIPASKWEISQGYVPLPAILYGLNYFSTTSEFVIVCDNESAKEAVKHITNRGKYSFCYQKLEDNAEIFQCTVVFGKTINCSEAVATIARRVYDLFSIPLMQMVLLKNGDNYTLSSVSHVRYSHLSEKERNLLEAYISHQEFL